MKESLFPIKINILPIDVTEGRILIFDKDEHPLKALCLIWDKEVGISICSRKCISSNWNYIWWTLDDSLFSSSESIEIKTSVNDVHPLKAYLPIEHKEEYKIICFNDEQSEKEYSPILITEFGIFICVKFSHPLNEYSIMDVIDGGIEIRDNAICFWKTWFGILLI